MFSLRSLSTPLTSHAAARRALPVWACRTFHQHSPLQQPPAASPAVAKASSSAMQKSAVRPPPPKRQPFRKNPLPPPRIVTRPPVITIMGHVDHGKTTLLDRLRGTCVAAGEAGGITQTIGAFQVEKNGRVTTWIDTPGHEAFAAMRHTGAHSTDVVVLVVASDAGVQPQTEEAARLCLSLALPVVVAINKCDKERGTIAGICEDLTRVGLRLEQGGGDVQVIPISALTGEGLPELIEAVSLCAEMLELNVPETCPVEGIVLECRQVPTLGGVVSAIAFQGTGFQPGQYLVADKSWGRVRVLRNERAESIQHSSLSQPVEIAGLCSPLPAPGSRIIQVKTREDAERLAKEAQTREQIARAEAQFVNLVNERKINTEAAPEAVPTFTHSINRNGRKVHVTASGEMYYMHPQRKRYLPLRSRWSGGWQIAQESPAEGTETKTVTAILKADTSGSMAALEQLLSRFCSHKEIRLDIVGSSVGEISASEIDRISLSDGYIISFSQRPLPANITYKNVLRSPIIYQLFESIGAILLMQLPDREVRKQLGVVQFLATFPATIKHEGKKRKFNVFGGAVSTGSIWNGAVAEVRREGKVVFSGKIISLRFHKEVVAEVVAGSECGVVLSDHEFLPQTGDSLHCYSVSYGRPTLEEEFGAPPPLTYESQE